MSPDCLVLDKSLQKMTEKKYSQKPNVNNALLNIKISWIFITIFRF